MRCYHRAIDAISTSHLAAQFAVTRALAESATLAEAAPRLLRALCTEMGWDVGAIFVVDPTGEEIGCVASHSLDEAWVAPFVETTRRARFRRGVGLPGRVLATGAPAWIPDVTRDGNFPRAPVASRCGLHAALGFPILEEDQVTGVLEIFSREIRLVDDGLMRMMADLGHQIGQFAARRRAEEALRAQTHLLQMVLQAHSDLGEGYLVGEGNRILDANEAYCRMIGYTRDELCSLPSFFEMVSGDELERMRKLREEHLAGRPTQMPFTTTIVRRDGRRVVMEGTGKPLRPDGDWNSFIAIVRDVTERRDAEDALRRSEARFRALIERCPEAVAVVHEGRTLYVNPAAAHLLGWHRADDLVGRSTDEWSRPDEAPSVADRSGETGPVSEQRWIRRDGGSLTVECASIPIEFDGKPAVLVFGRDVTERKQLEARLQRADRLASLGTLAGGVAHEINNPLTWVLLHLGYLGRELPRIADELERGEATSSIRRLEAAASRVAEMREGVERIEAIVRDLRTFSRPEGPDADAREPIDVCRVLDSAVNLTAGELRHRAALTRQYDPVPRVIANEPRLGQLFLNLLINAGQAIPPGDASRNAIRLATRTDGARVVVEISDTGAGIPPEIVPRVFDPFFTTRTAGVGLGLSICHAIARSLDGEIGIDSRPGAGTTVRVWLPAEANVDATPRERERPRLLVVEDEEQLAAALSRVLSDEFDVSLVAGSRGALELLLGGARYDAILCDLLLPDGSGIELYDALRARLPGAEERLVFMSGATTNPRMREFLSRVPNPRIDKPFDTQELQELLRARIR